MSECIEKACKRESMCKRCKLCSGCCECICVTANCTGLATCSKRELCYDCLDIRSEGGSSVRNTIGPQNITIDAKGKGISRQEIVTCLGVFKRINCNKAADYSDNNVLPFTKFMTRKSLLIKIQGRGEFEISNSIDEILSDNVFFNGLGKKRLGLNDLEATICKALTDFYLSGLIYFENNGNVVKTPELKKRYSNRIPQKLSTGKIFPLFLEKGTEIRGSMSYLTIDTDVGRRKYLILSTKGECNMTLESDEIVLMIVGENGSGNRGVMNATLSKERDTELSRRNMNHRGCWADLVDLVELPRISEQMGRRIRIPIDLMHEKRWTHILFKNVNQKSNLDKTVRHGLPSRRLFEDNRDILIVDSDVSGLALKEVINGREFLSGGLEFSRSMIEEEVLCYGRWAGPAMTPKHMFEASARVRNVLLSNLRAGVITLQQLADAADLSMKATMVVLDSGATGIRKSSKDLCYCPGVRIGSADRRRVGPARLSDVLHVNFAFKEDKLVDVEGKEYNVLECRKTGRYHISEVVLNRPIPGSSAANNLTKDALVGGLEEQSEGHRPKPTLSTERRLYGYRSLLDAVVELEADDIECLDIKISNTETATKVVRSANKDPTRYLGIIDLLKKPNLSEKLVCLIRESEDKDEYNRTVARLIRVEDEIQTEFVPDPQIWSLAYIWIRTTTKNWEDYRVLAWHFNKSRGIHKDIDNDMESDSEDSDSSQKCVEVDDKEDAVSADNAKEMSIDVGNVNSETEIMGTEITSSPPGATSDLADVKGKESIRPVRSGIVVGSEINEYDYVDSVSLRSSKVKDKGVLASDDFDRAECVNDGSSDDAYGRLAAMYNYENENHNLWESKSQSEYSYYSEEEVMEGQEISDDETIDLCSCETMDVRKEMFKVLEDTISKSETLEYSVCGMATDYEDVEMEVLCDMVGLESSETYIENLARYQALANVFSYGMRLAGLKIIKVGKEDTEAIMHKEILNYESLYERGEYIYMLGVSYHAYGCNNLTELRACMLEEDKKKKEEEELRIRERMEEIQEAAIPEPYEGNVVAVRIRSEREVDDILRAKTEKIVKRQDRHLCNRNITDAGKVGREESRHRRLIGVCHMPYKKNDEKSGGRGWILLEELRKADFLGNETKNPSAKEFPRSRGQPLADLGNSRVDKVGFSDIVFDRKTLRHVKTIISNRWNQSGSWVKEKWKEK